MSPSIKVEAIPAFADNYIWLIHDQTNQCAVVVDPGDADPVFAYLEQHNVKLVAILITHHHHDHTGGLSKLAKAYECLVFGPSNDSDSPDILGITKPLIDGDEFDIAPLDLHFRVITTPGHTLDHISFVGHDLLFCGDTLFSSGCGRMFEGTPEVFTRSLQRLQELPDQTVVYCAHEYTLANLRFAQTVEPNSSAILARQEQAQRLRQQNQPTVPTTLALERQVNPFLRTGETTVRRAVEQFANRSLTSRHEVFAHLRQWKDQF